MTKSEPDLLSVLALQVVWDDRARHGVDLVARFNGAKSAYPITLALIRKRRKLRKKAREELQEAIRLGIPSRRLERRAKRRSRRFESALSGYLSQIQLSLTSPGFRLHVVRGPSPVGVKKQTFRLRSVGYDVTFFAARVLERDIVRAFSLKHGRRTDIVRSLIAAIHGKWPKTIVRADIEAFYESIPHKQLLELVDSNSQLSTVSRMWIRDILSSYSLLFTPAATVGIPRGVGPSAALAEAYMSRFDVSIRDRQECVYYARYVDDIVAVMAPVDSHDYPTYGYLGLMQEQLHADGLTLSSDPNKRHETTVTPGAAPATAELSILGYSVTHDIASGEVGVDLSPRRLTRVTLRIERAFAIYTRSKSQSGLSAKLLEMRVRFLTGNTRLINSKKDAFVGIRFSNPLLNRLGGIQSLDKVLRRNVKKIEAAGTAPGVVARLRKHSFKAGYAEARYVRFSDSEWRQIASAWRDIG